MDNSSPFSSFPLIKTCAIEEAEDQLSRSVTDLEILSVANRERFHLNMNGVNFRQTSLVYNHFGSDTLIRSRTPGDSLIFIVGDGTPATFTIGGESVTVSPKQAAVTSPNHDITVNRPKGSEVLVVRILQVTLNSYFQSTTEQYYKNPLLFPAGVKLDKGAGVRLKKTLRFIIEEMMNHELLDMSPGLPKIYDHMLLTALLDLPHSHRGSIKIERSSYDEPMVVRIAEEFIEAHITEPLTISDLLPVCRCSRRTLFYAFQTARGYSPMEFLIERRLQRANKIFEERGQFTSVASIALESGFTHLGRFSQTYKKRFGETPSETIRKYM